MDINGGSEWGEPVIPGPPEFDTYQRLETAVRARQNLNPDRWGQVSGFLLAGLLATLFTASLVFGLTWNKLTNEDRLGKSEIDALWDTYNDLVAELQDVPLECDCEGVNNLTFPDEFPDDEFAIFDGDEPSRILVFELDPMSPGTNPPQTLSVQNANGTVAYLSDIPNYPIVFNDDEFAVHSSVDSNTRIAFDASAVASGIPTILSIQDTNGTVAYLDDITDPTNTTVYAQDEFEIRHAGDTTKKVRFDVDSLVGGGFTSTITVPDKSGIIAYLSDFVRQVEFPDNVFELFSAGDNTKKMQFNASNAVSGIPTVMTIQNRNGTLAYRDQLVEFVEVDITEDRVFPSVTHEGFASIQAMGITQIMIWMCGGGGNGRMTRSLAGEVYGGGGGGGGGHRQLFIPDPGDYFSHFTITIGAGGEGTLSTPCANGGTTVITGARLNPTEDDAWQLYGYGGGCGAPPITSVDTPTVFYGGCGAGNGGSPPGIREAGTAGTVGGSAGACGSVTTGANIPRFGIPWQGGAHGASYGHSSEGFIECTTEGDCPSSAVATGVRGLGIFGGAGGMFGRGGDSFPDYPNGPDAAPNSCAGGGARTDPGLGDQSFGKGGDGRVYIRYWTI